MNSGWAWARRSKKTLSAALTFPTPSPPGGLGRLPGVTEDFLPEQGPVLGSDIELDELLQNAGIGESRHLREVFLGLFQLPERLKPVNQVLVFPTKVGIHQGMGSLGSGNLWHNNKSVLIINQDREAGTRPRAG